MGQVVEHDPERVGRRLEPGPEDDRTEAVDLLVGEMVALDLGLHEEGDEVICALPPAEGSATFLDQGIDVQAEFGPGSSAAFPSWTLNMRVIQDTHLGDSTGGRPVNAASVRTDSGTA